MIRRKISYALLFLFLSGLLLCGCSDSGEHSNTTETTEWTPVPSGSSQGDSRQDSQKTAADTGDDTPSGAALRDNTPKVLTPEASGSVAVGNDTVVIDASHTESGYFMVRYRGSNPKVKLRVNGPDGSEYIYLLSDSQEYETFPLPCGSGSYNIQVLENTTGDKYAVAYSTDLSASIQDEFAPFLYPNQYVNFNESSQTVSKGSELAADCHSDLEVVEHIYNFVTEEISYDTQKAESVTYGYLPVVDETLSSKKGICFDYAAIMSAMLRSQGIPTKLEIGYSGEAYHAWISTYIKEAGWVDNIIEFDGSSWTLMDPTLAASNNAATVKEYVGDGSNYIVKFSY